MAPGPGDGRPGGAEGSVLVIEDDADNRDNLGEILVHEGYACRLAASADEACELLRSDDDPPSVILLDWRLPGMDAARFVSIVR
jgi:CheY-like chemotaxis protein